MTRLKPYKKYKDSGVEWLGEIPEGWEVQKVKYLGLVENSGCYGEEPGIKKHNRLVATTAHITANGALLRERMPTRSFSDTELERYSAEVGDIFIVKSSGSVSNIISGKCALVDQKQLDVVFSNFLLRFRPDQTKILPEYIYYLLKSHLTRQRIERMVSGTTYPNLDVSEYTNSLVPLPNKDEQAKIVVDLNYVESLVSKYTKKVTQQIHLLKELRQKIITQAVTCGVDENGNLRQPPKYLPAESWKDSGVAWLGPIHSNWEVKPGKACFVEKKVKNKGLVEKQVLSLSYGKIVIKDPEKLRGLVPENFESYQIASPDNIIIRSTDLQNDKVSLRVGLVRDTGIITSAYLCLQTTPLIHSDFAYLLLHSYDIQKVLYSLGSGLRQNLSYADFKYLPVVVPSYQEQLRIVGYINNRLAWFETQLTTLKSQLETIAEFQDALVSQFITGKVHLVRDEK